MAVTLTYDATLGRVRITANGLGAANQALVERSTDQIRWTTVRGGGAVPVAAGSMVTPLDDFEFSPNVLSYYRVSAVSTVASAHVATGASASADNASVTPGLPVGWAAGDLHVLLASIRNSGTGTVNTPAGWTPIAATGNVAMFGRRAVAGDVAPTVTFAGGVVGATTIAQIYGRRNAELVPVTVATQLNGSAQNIAYPAAAIAVDGCVVLVAGWKQDDWTSVATLAGATENAEVPVILGDDAGIVWDRITQTTAANIPAGAFVVTGGVAAISRSIVAAFRRADFINQQTSSITVTVGEVWLKSISRPFLNMTVEAILRPSVSVTRPARVGIFDVLGRTLPVAVSSVRGSRRWTMYVRTWTAAKREAMEYLLASGDVILIQAPAGSGVQTGYVSVGDAEVEVHPLRVLRATFTLPLTEVAPPGPDVVGSLGTWATVLATYATWSDVIAANATWADLLNLVGDPSEVIVP